MKKSLISVLSLLLVVPMVACSQPVAADIVKSNKPRITLPDVSTGDKAALVEGNSAFAFDLYQSLRTKDGNLFYSPESISMALAMTYAGARGDTEKQIADTLHFTLPQTQLHPASNNLDIELGKRG